MTDELRCDEDHELETEEKQRSYEVEVEVYEEAKIII